MEYQDRQGMDPRMLKMDQIRGGTARPSTEAFTLGSELAQTSEIVQALERQVAEIHERLAALMVSSMPSPPDRALPAREASSEVSGYVGAIMQTNARLRDVSDAIADITRRLRI